MNGSKWIGVAVALGLAAWGQEMKLAGPSAGLVYDAPTGSVVRIVGMPGGARLGDAEVGGVEWASVAPDGRTVVYVKDGVARWYAGGEERVLAGVDAKPALAGWSADSRSVLLYSEEGRQTQWVKEGEVEAAVALAGVEGAVTALAVDGSTRSVAVAAAGVYRWTGGEMPERVLEPGDVAGLVFEAGAAKLYVADRAGAQVLVVAGKETGVVVVDGERLKDISAIGLAGDGRRMYVAERGSMKLYVVDPGAAELGEGVGLDAPVTGFLAMGRQNLMLLGQRDKAGDPLYFLNVDGANGPAVLFVPAPEGR